MKKTFKSVLPVMLVFLFGYLNAQQIKPLKVGDKVPDIILEKMLNHRAPSGKLSDFKGKAIIIDQWFIGCAPCVNSMRHMDSLQKKFVKDLIVLPVTFEKKKAVESFWANNILVQGLKFVQAVEDTAVRSYFPVRVFPQQIWINKSGILVAITDGATTNIQNVQKLVEGQSLNLETKKDEMDNSIRMADNPNILIRYDETKNKMLYYSYFSSYRKELAGMSRSIRDSTTNTVRVTANNSSLFHLYNFAYSNNSWASYHFPTRFIRKDTSPIKSLIETVADTTFLFCYDLVYKGNNTEGFGKYMVQDLDRFFKLKSSEVLMDIECYVFSPLGSGKRFLEVYQPERKPYYTISLYNVKKVLVNNHWPWMVERIVNQTSNELILFEVAPAKRINLEVDWNLKDLDKMNKQLANFDLKIEKVIRKRKVIVLQDL